MHFRKKLERKLNRLERLKACEQTPLIMARQRRIIKSLERLEIKIKILLHEKD